MAINDRIAAIKFIDHQLDCVPRLTGAYFQYLHSSQLANLVDRVE